LRFCWIVAAEEDIWAVCVLLVVGCGFDVVYDWVRGSALRDVEVGLERGCVLYAKRAYLYFDSYMYLNRYMRNSFSYHEAQGKAMSMSVSVDIHARGQCRVRVDI
jgi:hypothetical protein